MLRTGVGSYLPTGARGDVNSRVTLLAPTSAVIAGIVGLTLLVGLYLLRLRRRPLWVSSTLFWHASARDLEVNVPIRMIRPSWLLLLHAITIALVALAIGRPAIDADDRATSRVVLLIDRSASMGAIDAVDPSGRRITRLAAAVEHARRTIRDLRRADASSAAIVTFASRPAIAAPISADWSTLERVLAEIVPTEEPDTGLAETLELIRAMLLQDADEAAPPARVLVLSDGGPAPLPDAAIPGAIIEFVRLGPDPSLPTDNLGIIAIAARRAADSPSRVRAFARVLSSASSRRDAVVVFLANGSEFARRPISIDPAASGPAEASVVAEVDLAGEGTITIRIERPDVLAADNEASLTIDATRPSRIMLVSPTGDPERDGVWPLLDVLHELPRLTVRSLSSEAWNSLASAEPGADLFADLIVLADVDPGWAIARPIGVPVLAFGVRPPTPDVALEAGDRPSGKIIAWDRQHPLTRHLALDTVLTSGGNLLRLASGSTSHPVAWSDAGIAIVCSQVGSTRSLSVAFPISGTNWPLQASWPLFIENALDWLTRRSESESGRFWQTGEPIAVPGLPPGSVWSLSPSASVVSTAGPDGTLNLPAQARSGLYRLESTSPTPARAVPVALLNADESACRTSDRLSVGATPIQGGMSAGSRRELWPWFVAALAAVLALEWGIFASRSRI